LLLLLLRRSLISTVYFSYLCYLPLTFPVLKHGMGEWSWGGRGEERGKNEFAGSNNWTFQIVKLLALGKCIEF